MSSTATPYGLRPINLVGGQVYAGGFRQIKMTDSYGTAIFTGDVVKMVSGGTVEKDVGTDAMTPIGVFMGCSYTDPSLNYKLFNNQWPASTVATDIMAYVVDDPDATFLVQADAAIQQIHLGENLEAVQTAGSTAIGRSKVAVNATAATTNTFPFKLVDFWDAPDSVVADAFTDVIVMFNTHHYNTVLGR